MMKKLLTATLFFCGAAAAASAADDSVSVNLSVLDSLGSGMASVAPAVSEPRFPIVKKASVIKKKPAVKKSAAPKVKVEAAVKSPAPAAPKPEPQQIPFVQNAEPVEVVDVEPVAAHPAETKPAPVMAPDPVKETPATANEAPSPDLTPAQTAASVAAAPAAEPKLLVDDNMPALPKAKTENRLVFAADVDELSDEQRSQIDAIISSFADAANNKIAIYAYNLDNGEDTFRRKRLSLNRAVAVRSYLLPKGYKNFSIKVVNVDAASGRADTVELEELK